MEELKRLEWLLGPEKVATLREKQILLFGCGGVGSFAMEALVRSGIGRIVLVDGDSVDPSNMNRQLIATKETIGKVKVEAAAERCYQISPYIEVEPRAMVYTKEAAPHFIEEVRPDFIIDAVDLMTAKIDIIEEAYRLGIPVISSMGMGNKLDPTAIAICPIEETTVCPLARRMRKELKSRSISGVPVVFSKEKPRTPQRDEDAGASRSPGSCGFVPSAAGLAMASYVIRQLTGEEPEF